MQLTYLDRPQGPWNALRGIYNNKRLIVPSVYECAFRTITIEAPSSMAIVRKALSAQKPHRCSLMEGVQQFELPSRKSNNPDPCGTQNNERRRPGAGRMALRFVRTNRRQRQFLNALEEDEEAAAFDALILTRARMGRGRTSVGSSSPPLERR